MPPKGSLASLLGTLTSAAPADFDPESMDPVTADNAPSEHDSSATHDSSDEDDDQDEDAEYLNPRAHYADVGPSQMRKKAMLSESEKLQDRKYEGVKATRAELYASSDQEEEVNGDSDSIGDSEEATTEDEDDEGEVESPDGSDSDVEQDSDEMEDVEEDEEDEEAGSDEEGNKGSRSLKVKRTRFADQDDGNEDDEEETPGLASTSNSNSIAAQVAQSAAQTKALKAQRLQDAEKGRQVRKQIKTYERVLESRIKAQSLLREVNKLPDPPLYSSLVTSDEGKSVGSVVGVLERLLELSETLFSLRRRLSGANAAEGEQVQVPASRKRKRDFDISLPEDQEEASKAWKDVSGHDQIVASVQDVLAYSAAQDIQRRAVLDKWSLKVTSAASAASNGNSFSNLKAVNQPPSVQIDSALSGDGLHRLINRTRILRGEGESARKIGTTGTTNGKEEEDGADPEVFDDSDFYSHILKDLIERRSGSSELVAGAAAANLFSAGKKKRQNVDTRASKGRKLKYDVNDKLVNFMPPMKDRVKWTEEQIERLFRQLAASSAGGASLEDDLSETEAAEEEQVANLGGLRVFG